MNYNEVPTPAERTEMYDCVASFIAAGGNQESLLDAWALYETLDGVFGSEFALATETQRLIDLVAKVTADPEIELSGYAQIVFDRLCEYHRNITV